MAVEMKLYAVKIQTAFLGTGIHKETLTSRPFRALIESSAPMKRLQPER
jgi:hypothetical protein